MFTDLGNIADSYISLLQDKSINFTPIYSQLEISFLVTGNAAKSGSILWPLSFNGKFSTSMYTVLYLYEENIYLLKCKIAYMGGFLKGFRV